MRKMRCTECGETFYSQHGSNARLCNDCSGEHDPSAQIEKDAKTAEAVNDIRTLGKRKQTVDLKKIAEASK